MTSLGKAQENTSTLYKPNNKQALLHELGAKARERLFCAGNRPLVYGTLVCMADGTKKPIEEVKVGDEVLSYNKGVASPTKVVDIPYDGVEEVYEITSSDGSSVTATADHEFLVSTKNSTYKKRSRLDKIDIQAQGLTIPRCINFKNKYKLELYQWNNSSIFNIHNIGDTLKHLKQTLLRGFKPIFISKKEIGRYQLHHKDSRFNSEFFGFYPVPKDRTDYTHKPISNIESKGLKPVRCITIAHSSHLFLVNDFIVTSNCGKTFAASQEMSYHLTGLYPKWWKGVKYKKPIKAWVASNSSQSTRDILQVAYLGGVSRKDFGTGSIPKECIDRTVMSRGIGDAVETLHVKHKSGGISELGFKSYDQGREKFQGTSKHFIHLDEEPPMKVYEECLLRTLTTKGSIITSMTPLSGITNMVKRFWNADLPAGVVVDSKALVTASWDDTEHLTQEDKDEFRRSLPAHVLEAREKGIPAIGEGMVYPIEESAITCQRFPIPDHYKRFFAMDFGWNPDPTVALFFAYDEERDILYIHDEYSQNEATPKAHAALIMGKGGDWLSGVADPYGGVTSSISDGENMIDKYNAVGLKIIPCIRAAKLNGIIDVLEMMKEGRLKIFSDLGGLWDEFRMYAYDSKGKPKDKDDHFMDTMRYGVQSGMSVAKSKKDLKKNSWLNRWSGGISNKIDWRTI